MTKGMMTLDNLNPLPVPTMQHLKVNSATMQVPFDIAPGKAECDFASNMKEVNIENGKKNMLQTGQEEDFSKLISLKTGMGQGIDDLFLQKEKQTGGLLNGVARTYIKAYIIEENQSKRPTVFLFKESGILQQLFWVKKGATATVIIDYRAKDFLGLQTKIYIEKNAFLHLIYVNTSEKESISFCDAGAVLEQNACLEYTQVQLSKGNSFLGCFALLQGENAQFQGKLGYITQGQSNFDVNYVVQHTGKNTKSNFTANGALMDTAQKTFRGTIDFVKGSSGAFGDERENVLLLSQGVVNKTVPLILCAEEDVEGKHGATIGNLGEKELFYMMSRGISKDVAQNMMAKSRVASIACCIPKYEKSNLAKLGQEDMLV